MPIVDVGASTGDRDTALLVFPTKALAQDQLRSLRVVAGARAARRHLRRRHRRPTSARGCASNANVVLTNPEMLHMGILPYHKRWATFLMRLRYVVVDELHTLRGIFGSHVAHVLRRLRRRLRALRRRPDVLLRRARRSATRPSSRRALCGAAGRRRSTTTARRRPSACSRCWQRPLLDAHTGRARVGERRDRRAARRASCADGHQTLAFTRSRRGAELVAQHARRRARATRRRTAPTGSRRTAPATCPRSAASSSASSRAASSLGVAATNALELGIDVGGLDAVVLNGFPGTLASMRQQAGRAGRTGRRSAAVLVAGDDQLDQWYAAPPAELLAPRRRSARS